MNRDQLYAMNIHYRYYDLEYFFRACQKMNLKHAELWLCPQHFYINSMWSESPEKLKGLMKRSGVQISCICPEQKRGHNLGRIIREGSAIPNTGIPGNIGGYTAERVIHAGAEGILYNVHKIGDIVEQGEEIAYIAGEKENRRYSVTATIPGIIRGLIRDGYPVTKGFKIADIDPRKSELSNCFTISDKARCIAGSVLEVVCAFGSNILS